MVRRAGLSGDPLSSVTISPVLVAGLPLTYIEGEELDGGFSLEVLATPLDEVSTISFLEALIEFTVLPMFEEVEGVTILIVLYAPLEILLGVTVFSLLEIFVGVTLLI